VDGSPLTRVNVVTGRGAAAESAPVMRTINPIKAAYENPFRFIEYSFVLRIVEAVAGAQFNPQTGHSNQQNRKENG
jgi:hypothetical protein